MQRQIAAIALPMVLSNLGVPLLGLVDTAVVGHLPYAHQLGGVALGSSVISLLLFLFSFLRMGTTGLTAQAYGRYGDGNNGSNYDAMLRPLQQGLLLAMLLGLALIALKWPLLAVLKQASDASTEVLSVATDYIAIRIWSAPAALCNMVLLGWFLGRQNARYPMWLLLFANSVNIVLDLLLVLQFNLQSNGVALASVIADYSTLALALYLLQQSSAQGTLQRLAAQFFSLHGSATLLKLNRDIFVRSLCLQTVFLFMAFTGATLGDTVVAANAILLSYLMLVSYALDGLAYAAESLVGLAIGRGQSNRLKLQIKLLGAWCLLLSVVFSLAYLGFGEYYVTLLTSIRAVQHEAALYQYWLVALPLVASWAYLLDGIFIGATAGRQLRNSMLIALAGFMLSYTLTQAWQNHALWAAMTMFMLLRSISLSWVLWCQWRAGKLFGLITR